MLSWSWQMDDIPSSWDTFEPIAAFLLLHWLKTSWIPLWFVYFLCGFFLFYHTSFMSPVITRVWGRSVYTQLSIPYRRTSLENWLFYLQYWKTPTVEEEEDPVRNCFFFTYQYCCFVYSLEDFPLKSVILPPKFPVVPRARIRIPELALWQHCTPIFLLDF